MLLMLPLSVYKCEFFAAPIAHQAFCLPWLAIMKSFRAPISSSKITQKRVTSRRKKLLLGQQAALQSTSNFSVVSCSLMKYQSRRLEKFSSRS